MQEVNLKKNYNFQFILLMFLFRAPSLCRKLQLHDLWICALVWRCQKHHFTIYIYIYTHTHTHTHTHAHALSLSLSSLITFLFAPLASHTWHHRELRKTYFCLVLFLYTDMRYHFQYVFSWWGIENFYVVFPYSVKESVTKIEIFQWLSKNA